MARSVYVCDQDADVAIKTMDSIFYADNIYERKSMECRNIK